MALSIVFYFKTEINTTYKHTQKINSKTNLYKWVQNGLIIFYFKILLFFFPFKNLFKLTLTRLTRKVNTKKNFWNWKLKRKMFFFWFQQTKKKKTKLITNKQTKQHTNKETNQQTNKATHKQGNQQTNK